MLCCKQRRKENDRAQQEQHSDACSQLLDEFKRTNSKITEAIARNKRKAFGKWQDCTDIMLEKCYSDRPNDLSMAVILYVNLLECCDTNRLIQQRQQSLEQNYTRIKQMEDKYIQNVIAEIRRSCVRRHDARSTAG